VAAWVVTFACLAALAQAIPPVEPAVIGDAPRPPQSISKLLELLVPTDLFTALSQNYVPAVVIFCIFYGVALQTLKDKAPLLSMLETIRLASLRFWNWIVRLAPIGVSRCSPSPPARPPSATSSTSFYPRSSSSAPPCSHSGCCPRSCRPWRRSPTARSSSSCARRSRSRR
jgi:hypothetical protein